MALADEIAKAKQLQQIANWDAAEKRLADGLLGLDIQVTLARHPYQFRYVRQMGRGAGLPEMPR